MAKEEGERKTMVLVAEAPLIAVGEQINPVPARYCSFCHIPMVCAIGNRPGASFRKFGCTRCKRSFEENYPDGERR